MPERRVDRPSRGGGWGLAIAATLAAAMVLTPGLAVASAAAADGASCTFIGVATWDQLVSDFGTGGCIQLDAPIVAPDGDSLPASSAAVVLDLDGNDLTIAAPAMSAPAIDVPSGSSLTIEDLSSSPGTLTATGGGGSEAEGAHTAGGAGIGGTGGYGTGLNAGTVVIDSGTVIATGTYGAAGIGAADGYLAGNSSTSSVVTINGGSVTATGSYGAAGIGASGNRGESGTATINGGTVTATGASDSSGFGGGGAGIGGGGAEGVVTVNGGTVTATGANGAAGIDGSSGGADVGVAINAGTVTVSSTGSAIAGSWSNSGSLIVPSGVEIDVPASPTVDSSGTVSLAGTLAGDGTLDNTGLITGAGSVQDSLHGDSLQVTSNAYELSFSLGSGSGTVPAPQYVYASSVADAGQSLPVGPTPHAGDDFDGWYTAASGGSRVTSSTPLAAALNGTGPLSVTLYAQYSLRTQPRISATVSSAHAKTRYGWYRAPVRVSFTCTPGNTPLAAPCPKPVTLTRSRAGQSVTRMITDTDGTVGKVTASGIKIDRIRPRVRVAGAKSGHTYSWAHRRRVLKCVSHDALSGIAKCRLRRHRRVTARYVETRYVATAVDRAGNRMTVRGQYRTRRHR